MRRLTIAASFSAGVVAGVVAFPFLYVYAARRIVKGR